MWVEQARLWAQFVNFLGYQLLAEWINAFTGVEEWVSKSRLEVPRPRPCTCQCWWAMSRLVPTRAHSRVQPCSSATREEKLLCTSTGDTRSTRSAHRPPRFQEEGLVVDGTLARETGACVLLSGSSRNPIYACDGLPASSEFISLAPVLPHGRDRWIGRYRSRSRLHSTQYCGHGHAMHPGWQDNLTAHEVRDAESQRG